MEKQYAYDLAIAYRVYPKVSKTPAIYHDDKYKLAELCAASLRKAIGNLKVKIFVIADACPSEYRALFEKYFTPEELIYRDVPATGNGGTFLMQIEQLLEQEYSDLVYFAEDDYFYLESALEPLVEFKRNRADADFVTAYDHPDYYNSELHAYELRPIKDGSRMWQKVSSTCLTFLTDKSTLESTKKIFFTYAKRNTDFSVWTTITRLGAFRFHAFAKYLFTNFDYFKMCGKCWLFGWKENIFTKPLNLYASVPALCTHMEKELLSPGVDWRREFERAELL